MVMKDTIKDARFIEGGDEAGVKLMVWLEKKAKSTETEGDLEIHLLQKAKTGEMSVDKFFYSLDESLEETVEQIIEAAERDAESNRHKTRYCVRIKDHSQFFSFTLNIPPIDIDDEDDFELDELPNKKGMLGLFMRHNEVFAKEMLTSARLGRNDILAENRDLRQENAQLRRLYNDQTKIFEELRNMQFARDLKIKEFQKGEDRKDKATEIFFKAAPLIASKLLGGEQGAQFAAEVGAGSPIEQMVDGFIQSLESNPEKLQKIITVLDPVDLAVFHEIHKRIQEKRAFEAQQAEQQQNGQNGQNGFPFAHGANPFNGFQGK
jgi:hypothetical protein